MFMYLDLWVFYSRGTNFLTEVGSAPHGCLKIIHTVEREIPFYISQIQPGLIKNTNKHICDNLTR